MLSPALPSLILTAGPLPDLNSSTYMSNYSLVMVSLGIFSPCTVPGSSHSQERDMLRNTFFQRPIQCSSSHVLGRTEMCVRVTLPAWAGRKMACWGVFCLVAVIWRGFTLLLAFIPDESSPPSASGVPPIVSDAAHIQRPQRKKSPGATAPQWHVPLTQSLVLISVFNAVSTFWG